MTPVQAIRAKCIDCMCGSVYEVRLCPSEDCSLYPFRMGHNPNRPSKRDSASSHATNPALTRQFGAGDMEGISLPHPPDNVNIPAQTGVFHANTDNLMEADNAKQN